MMRCTNCDRKSIDSNKISEIKIKTKYECIHLVLKLNNIIGLLQTRLGRKAKAYINKMLSYRRETALQGALWFWPKVEGCNWETIFYGHYRPIFNHCDNRHENLSNSVKNAK